MKHKAKGLLTAAALAVACCCLARFTGCLNVGMPRLVHLAEVLGTKTVIVLSLPEGEFHQIVFDVPTNGVVPSGRLAIGAAGKTVVDIIICPEALQDCNWLHGRSKGKTYILTWEIRREEPLRSLLEQRQRCYVELTLDTPPPEGLSLWLAWVEGVNVFAQSLMPRTQEQIDRSVRPSVAGDRR